MEIAITTRLVDTVTTPMLLKMALAGQIDPSSMITHSNTCPIQTSQNFQLMQPTEFAFKDIEEAYKTFGAAAEHKALKVLISVDDDKYFISESA